MESICQDTITVKWSRSKNSPGDLRSDVNSCVIKCPTDMAMATEELLIRNAPGQEHESKAYPRWLSGRDYHEKAACVILWYFRVGTRKDLRIEITVSYMAP